MDLADVVGFGLSAATGGFAGAVIRLLPALGSGVMDYFKQKGDRDHEYRMRQLDRDIAKDGAEQRVREADVSGHWEAEGRLLDAYKEALAAANKPTGIKWVDAANSAVRPVTAYYFLLLYGVAKTLNTVYAWKNDADLAALSKVVWTVDDATMMGAVFGFYFVDRQLLKSKQGPAGWTSSRS